MRKKKEDKGSKAVKRYGQDGVNEECRACIYYLKSTCKGRLNIKVPCVFHKPIDSDPDNWRDY